MSTRGAPDSWLGTSGEWGLSPHKHGELCDELSDHLSEMARVESHGAAQDAKETLSQPQTRRRLAGVHLADQVYATLNRLPDKHEWRELAWLGVWFVLILLGDWLALYAEGAGKNYIYMYPKEVASPGFIAINTGAWLVQAVARAGFFASFILCLVNAWKIGWGVLLARILQLKLIHTLLVIVSFLLLGKALWNSYPAEYGMLTTLPTWLYAPTFSIAFLLAAGLVLLVSKRRCWAFSFGLAMMAILLYVGGPACIAEVQVNRSIVYVYSQAADRSAIRTPETDQEVIAEEVAGWSKDWRENHIFDVESNRMQYLTEMFAYMPGHITAKQYDVFGHPNPPPPRYPDESFKAVSYLLQTPVTAAGAGMGWLAAPIPLLGIIGLFTMVLLMGRRGVYEFIAYGTICGLGIMTTVMPFLVGQPISQMVKFNSEGIYHSPFPGFEVLMVNPHFDNPLWWTLVGGLVLSAGAPWLLTGLFLKPGQSEQQVDDGDKMQEAGA